MASIIDFESGQDLENTQTLRQIQEDEDFARKVIDSSVDGILTYDRDFRYRIWNPAMEALTGVTREQAIGKIALDLFPIMRTRAGEAFHAALRGETYESDDEFFEFGGKGVYLQRRHSPLYDESGRIVGGLAVVRDVTERKLAMDEVKRLNHEMKRRLEARSPFHRLADLLARLFSQPRHS